MAYFNKENEDWFVQQVHNGRLIVSENGTIINSSTGNTIGAVGSGRYPKISLKDIGNNKIRHIQIHRLIYRIFKGEIPEDYEIHHKDNNKQNPSFNNLELVTAKQNTFYAIKDNLGKFFSKL